MDLTAVLKELRLSLDAVNVSIEALERVRAGQGPRRGRPPKWLAEAKPKPNASAKPTPKRARRSSATN